MKTVTTLLSAMLLIASGGCKRSDQSDSHNNVVGPTAEIPVTGRAEYAAATDLIPSPELFHRKRVILRGVWVWGFEHSFLHLHNDAQDFRIQLSISEHFDADSPTFDFRHFLDATAEPFKHAPALDIVAEGVFIYWPLEEPNVFSPEATFFLERVFSYESVDPTTIAPIAVNPRHKRGSPRP